jgi:glycosyltransferase involved in cell wall biosynthesis
LTARVDLLVVRSSTTFGLRHSEAQLVDALRDLGLSAATASTDFGWLGRLRVGQPLIDLVEAACISVATGRAARRFRPRAIIYPSGIAPLLEPRSRLQAAAIRYDSPTTVNRPGLRNSIQHLLERRARKAARVLAPMTLHTSAAALVPLPPILPAPRPEPASRQPVFVCYAANPEKKGLDIAVEAWQLAGTGAYQLAVTGISAEDGRRFLQAKGVAEPDNLRWVLGSPSAAAFQELLHDAEGYLSSSRMEEFGTSQAEALVARLLLVCSPSAGTIESLPIARRLDQRLVANDMSPAALALALDAAIAMSEAERTDYRSRAVEMMAPYMREAYVERLRTQIVPALLGEDWD